MEAVKKWQDLPPMTPTERMNYMQEKGIDTTKETIEIGSLIVKNGFIDAMSDEQFNDIMKEYEQEMQPRV